MSERQEGRLKNWFEGRGFGFIRCDNGEDIFVHISQCGFLIQKPGDRMSFEAGTNERTQKPEAKAVAILS